MHGVKILARSEIGIPVQLQKLATEQMVDNIDGFIEPNGRFENEDGLLVGKTLVVVKSGVIMVQVANISAHDIVLHNGTPVGTFHSTVFHQQLVGHCFVYKVVEKQPFQPVTSTIVGSTCKTGDARDNQKKRIPNVDLTNTCLTRDQQIQVQNLLEKYGDAFSKDSRGIERTTLLEHQIRTENAKPVKQRLYRLPHKHKTKAEEQLKTMTGDGTVKKSKRSMVLTSYIGQEER